MARYLSHAVKRRGRRLALLAAAIVAVHLVETYWLVAPAFHPAGLHLSWLDLAAPVGIGGVWIAAFVWLLFARDGSAVSSSSTRTRV